MSESLSRRDFVATIGSLGAVWLLADEGDRRAAADHAAHQVSQRQPSLSVLTREQAADLEAITSRIIPTDDSPGAREAGVVYFIDRALATWAKDQRPLFMDGLAKLPSDVSAKFAGQSRFTDLAPAQQDEVLKSIESSPFFGAIRFATIAGMFSLPSHGGNRDFVGWRLLGQDNAMEYKPPFGWYDTPANRRALLGGDA
ncbi:MAG: gluconate 2-dehydrogenase subunit 3 family protein [Gemmatimonadaceae bacterium]|nr:gluconate 2-dehydrogenase subunit 3 family protein [Gemmatimonadaceae bacterium]